MHQRSVEITLYSIIVTPFLFFFSFLFYKKIIKQFRESDESEAVMSTVLQESLSGVRVVRAFGRQQQEVEKFDAASSDLKKKNFRLLNSLAIFWGLGDLLSIMQLVVTLIVCVIFVVQGRITLGTLLLFNRYIGMLLFPIRQLGRILSDAGKAKVSIERLNEILHTPVEPEEAHALFPSLKGDIVFENVCFWYEKDKPILNNLSFTIPAGQTVAFLGPTGSGKSTLVALLQRLYEPKKGRILIGGVDIKNIDRYHLRAHVGLVLQEPFLYSKTIGENVGITLSSPQEDSIHEAAAIAHAHDFITESVSGYDTLVGERGVTLSGGQKQRVAIARTLLKDNDILIFDDSLSAVDTQTDIDIRQALKTQTHEVTTIIISHRLTTLSAADTIFVLEEGHITAQGDHETLLGISLLYNRIYGIQTSLEEEMNLEIPTSHQPTGGDV
ncbi:MAG: ABC transporter ATP-binding protein, partial [Clostridiales bacterium]|nr:ABC transporter ATP-binding protein [Clostridiales bacterium]